MLGEKYDEDYGIEHFVVDAPGISSWRFEIMSQEDAGFAIDNVSFESKESPFNFKFNLDKITHTTGSNVANSFTIYFKELESTDGSDLNDICNKYIFSVNDSAQELNQLSCDVNKAKKAFKIDFKIEERPYNLENADVYIKDKYSGDKEKIDDIKDFSVYGTDFKPKKDGFSFYNGQWNKFMLTENKEISLDAFFCWKFNLCTDAQVSYSGVMLKIVNAFKEFLADSDKEKAKELIGYYRIKDYTAGYESREREFGGVCHGLAVSAIANFNNKEDSDAWGTDLTSSKTKDEIVSIFQSHWDNRDSESAKPFFKNVYDYNIDKYEDALHSLAKIGYYFISQSSYGGGKAWVGKSNRQELNSISEMTDYHQQHLKKNIVSIFGFDLKKNGKRAGGHTIIATELIKYNNSSIVVLHDNNYVDELPMLAFTDSFELSSFITEDAPNSNTYTDYGDFSVKKRYSSYDSYYGFDTFTDGELFIYGKSKAKGRQKISQPYNDTDKTYDYPYPNHISVAIIGGKLLKITNTQTQQEVVLFPIVGEMESDKGYMKDDMLTTEFFLPKNKIYKIEFKKYMQYPAFDVYVKIPDNNGKVEIINYENVATNMDDDTLAHFFVGNGNSEKNIKREGESDVTPDYDESFDMKITPAVSLKAISFIGSVKLSWNLPDNPNLQEVVLIRKTESKPTAIGDGSEIYRGIAESYTDGSVSDNGKYYYAIYAVAKNGDVADANFIYVDTHKASLFGYVKDAGADPVIGAEVILKNAVGLIKNEIDSEITDQNGFFSFNNLALGSYLLEYSHPNYGFAGDTTVNLENKTLEVAQEAAGEPFLAINVNQVMKSGETETISWSGLNIADNDKISVELQRNNKWETLASELPFSANSFDWTVTGPDNLEATVKIELSSNTSINSEKKVYITPGDGCGVSAIFTADPLTGKEVPLKVNFDATGSTDGVYEWDYGDDSTKGMGKISSHTYNSMGIYTVTLTVTADDGCKATASETVRILKQGDADGSGKVDINDALIIALYDVMLKPQDEITGFAVADVDCNGKVNIFDALRIAEFDAGLVENFDCSKRRSNTDKKNITRH